VTAHPSYIQTIRRLVGHQRIFVPGVRAILLNERGEILLQHRSDSDVWGLPAGVVEMDETVFEALQREVEEETSIQVLEAEPIALYSGPEHRYTYPNGDQVQCFAMSFLVTKWEGCPRVNDDESRELRFFAIDEIPAGLFSTHRVTIDDYTRYDGRFIAR
jgi:ADP-ribose pyrophosphatase YjhB (NUDIX family)